MAVWTVAVEGPSDVPIAEAILSACGHQLGAVYGLAGKGALDKRLPAWRRAARHSRWLVLRDLDRAPCAPTLSRSLGGGPGDILRIAVRSGEAWLLADRERAAAWLGVAVSKIPSDVESLEDPKLTLLNLARRSKRKDVRLDLVPRDRAMFGPGHVDQVVQYCRLGWRPSTAARSAPSLRRCLDFLRAH